VVPNFGKIAILGLVLLCASVGVAQTHTYAATDYPNVFTAPQTMPYAILGYILSESTNPASTGVVRMSTSDCLAWKNNANSGNLGLCVNVSDQLMFNGVVLNAGSGITSLGFQNNGSPVGVMSSSGVLNCVGCSFSGSDPNYTLTIVGGTAAGSNTQMQFNCSGVLCGDTDLTYNSGTHTHTLGALGILDLHSAGTGGLKLSGGFSTGLIWVTTTTGAVASLVGTQGQLVGMGASGTPVVVSPNRFIADEYGVPADDSTDACAAFNTGGTGLLAKVQAAGGGIIQLSGANLTKLMTCDLVLPANTIIEAMGNPSSILNAALPPPKSGLHFTFATSNWHIQCLQFGTCGLRDMYVSMDVASTKGIIFTGSTPVLHNVVFRGLTPAQGGGGNCADSTHACPSNDGAFFGNPDSATYTSCVAGSTLSDFCGYGAPDIDNVHFQNMRQWAVLGADVNVTKFLNLVGDYSDSYPTGAAFENKGRSSGNYGNTVTLWGEQAPFLGTNCGYASLIKLTSFSSRSEYTYSSSDASQCIHSFKVVDNTSQNNFITVLYSNTSGSPVDDFNAGSVGNTVLDLTTRTFSSQSIVASAISGVNTLTFGSTVQGSLPAGGNIKTDWIHDSMTGDCATGGGSIEVWCFYNGSAWVPIGNQSSPTFTAPVIGAATGLSLSVTGKIDGQIPVLIDTTTPVTVGTTNQTSYHLNQNATAATAIVYNLPGAAAGRKYCFANSYNGSAADTGTLKIQTSIGQFIIASGTLSVSNGYIISLGSAGDEICVLGVDTTHWEVTGIPAGSWTLH
jgi:hypothetical protein